MNYETAKKKILEDSAIVTNLSWGACKTIRKWEESDADFFQQVNFETKNLIMEDCQKRLCDCTVHIWQPTEEDIKSTEYIVL